MKRGTRVHRCGLYAAALLATAGAAIAVEGPATQPVAAGTTATRPTTMPDSPETPQQRRAAFLKLIARPPAELDPREEASIAEPEDEGFVRIGFSFSSEPEQRVPGLLLKRHQLGGRRPAVVVLHGTGGTKEQMLPHLRRFARRGYLAIAIDARHSGARIVEPGLAAYHGAIANSFIEANGRHPYLYDTVWDVHRLLDYLATRHDVDMKRVAVIGFSKGGTEAYLAAATDERIAACVPCIGVQSFAYALEHDLWQSRIGTLQPAVDAAARHAGVDKVDAAFVRRFYERVVPGIDGRFDGPAMLPLAAPRPMLVITGETDDRTPLPGVRQCVDSARVAYRALHASDALELRVQQGVGHRVTDESMDYAAKWIGRWLDQ